MKIIKIKPFNQNSSSDFIRDINKTNSMLIIGRGSNSYKLNEFIKPKNYSEVQELYGDSELTRAYLEAIEAGAKNIFIMNCYKITDYIDSIEYVKQYNFAYVVPIGINLSDRFYSEKYKKEMFYAEFYLREFSLLTNSLIIFTDNHGSLYENINDYLKDMRSKVMRFKEAVSYTLENDGRNLAFALNMLINRDYANVVLAAILSKTKVGEYPSELNYKACYDMHKTDMQENELIYFQNNVNINTTIENLNNFRSVYDANKVIVIDQIIKYIEKNLDLSFVLGKLYTSFLKIDLMDYLDMFFRKELTSIVRKYLIGKINFVPLEDMTGYIEINISIWPINSLEYINILLEVR